MKKIFILMTALLLSTGAFAQTFTNIHFTPVTLTTEGWDVSQRVWADLTFCTDNSTSYAEIQKSLNTAEEFYVQLFHEQKFWETPIYIHAEYRAQYIGAVEHMLMIGGTYSLGTKNGFIAFEPLCRIDGQAKDWGHVQPMLSVVTGHDWGIFNLNSFTDFWYDCNYLNNGFNWYSEYWSYFNVCDYVELGFVGSFAYSSNVFFAGIAPAIKITF